MVTILLAYEDLELFPNSNARYVELEGWNLDNVQHTNRDV